MSRVYFSAWQDEFIDNRNTPLEEWKESSYKFPVQYNIDKTSKAFIGWEGFVLFDENVDIVKVATEYASQYQLYSEACGRCAPGRWGGRVLYDLCDKIARGEGELNDLTHLKETASMMMATSKCEIGRTVPVPLVKMVEMFEDKFLDLINNKKSSPDYDNSELNYIAKVTAPCMDACPAHVDIPSYIEGVRDLDLANSLKSTRQTMPLAHTCGRVCPHPCEDACRRENLDSAISIMELKRVGADYETNHSLNFFHPKTKKEMTGKKVAIIGAGPAGLTTAYYLLLDGVACDVYEELPVLGGEVAVGVPEYRMPYDRYYKDIEAVKDLGANFILNTKVTPDMMREFEKNYDAIMIATGARISKKIRANNERFEIDGYWPAIPFLDQINLWDKWQIGEKVDLTGKTVVCVGGGFTSMDVVRCSVRAGAKKVVMLYRRDEKTIIGNTSLEEYHEAVEEGVEFIFHSSVEELICDENNPDKLVDLKVNRFEIVPDPNGGRAKLVKIIDGDFHIKTDYLIPAVSQDADLSLLPKEWELDMTSWRTLKTDGKHYMTSRKGVFTAGDCEYGPMTIVNAVGQAKRASSVMSRYLQNGEISRNDDEIMEDHLHKLRVYNKKEKVKGWVAGLPRAESEKMAVSERIDNNKEVNYGFTQQEAIDEASRCMRCYYIAMTVV